MDAKTAARRWWGRLPWGLLGMVLLVGAGERFVARGGMDFLDVDDWAFRRSARTAATAGTRYDVLCFGESLVKLGVVPRAVEARSGLRTYNLAVSGSQAPASYFLLKRAMDGGARPKAVVVDFAPMMFRLGPDFLTRRWAALLSVPELARLAWWAGDANFFGAAALARVLPTVEAREGLRASILGALAGTGDRRRYSNFLAQRNWGKNDGAQFMPAPANAHDLTFAEANAVRDGFYPKFVCRPENARGVEAFLRLAAENKIRVYWLLTPLMPGVHHAIEASGYDASHEAFVRGWQAKYSNVTVVDGRGAVEEAKGFFDANHLSGEGAYAFSLALGDALRKDVGAGAVASRWLAIRGCKLRGVPEGALEDTEQSRLALEAREKGVRGR